MPVCLSIPKFSLKPCLTSLAELATGTIAAQFDMAANAEHLFFDLDHTTSCKALKANLVARYDVNPACSELNRLRSDWDVIFKPEHAVRNPLAAINLYAGVAMFARLHNESTVRNDNRHMQRRLRSLSRVTNLPGGTDKDGRTCLFIRRSVGRTPGGDGTKADNGA